MARGRAAPQTTQARPPARRQLRLQPLPLASITQRSHPGYCGRAPSVTPCSLCFHGRDDCSLWSLPGQRHITLRQACPRPAPARIAPQASSNTVQRKRGPSAASISTPYNARQRHRALTGWPVVSQRRVARDLVKAAMPHHFSSPQIKRGRQSRPRCPSSEAYREVVHVELVNRMGRHRKLLVSFLS